MAVTEALSALSTTAASNTPAGTDSIGTDLDDHLREIKKNVRFASNHPVQAAKITAYTVVATDHNTLLQVNATASAVTVTLLAAATAGDGFRVGVKRLNTTNAVTVDGNSSETIDGSITSSLSTLNQVQWYACDGSNWQVEADCKSSSSVITTRGDVIRGSSSGIAERLGIGSSGQALTSDGTDVVWGSGGGSSVGTESIIRTNATNIIANTTLSEKELTYTAVHGAETLSRGTNDGFANGDTVQLLNSGGAAPAGWSVGTQYYVVSVAAATMQLSTSFGGGAEAISDNGTGTNTVYKNINGMTASPITIDSGTVTIRSGCTWNII